MPAATKTTSTIVATITQQSFYDNLKTALNSAGFTILIDEFTDGSNTKWAIYEVTVNSAATRGKFYFQVGVSTALILQTRISLDWNSSANTFTAALATNQVSTVAFGSSSNLVLTSFSHAEYRALFLQQGTTLGLIGYLRPASKPSWWNEDLYLYSFLVATSTGKNFVGTYGSNSPFNQNTAINSNYYFNSPNCLSTANPITNKREILPSCLLETATNQGFTGKTSEDICLVAASGLAVLDTLEVTSGVEEYTLISTGASGLAIRTV